MPPETTAAPDTAANGAAPARAAKGVAGKPGRHREASLYHALHGAGASDGRSLAELRSTALAAYERSELPVWRRSGFWTTSFAELDLDALGPGETAQGTPAFVSEALPDRPRAGRIVQVDNATAHVELDEALAAKGVVLCSLEHAAEAHPELFARWFSKRLTIDRHKLEAANAAFWSAGAFLHVPDGILVEDPFEIVYAISGPGVAQYGRTLAIGGAHSDFKVHEHNLASDLGDGDGRASVQSLHAGAFEMYLQDGARARLAQVQDWSPADQSPADPSPADQSPTDPDRAHPGPARPIEVFDASTRFVGVGRDAYCHWLPALLGGRLVRHHLELAVSEPGGDMAFRGLFFTERDEHLDAFAVDLHETGPSGGDVHWRGAATGSSRASFEGLIQIDPGSQQTHTYLQIHTMMLSPKARLDAIPSVLVSADDVSASHGGTVGELDESSIFYMQSRGLDRATAVKVLVEGFFEPVLGQLQDEPLEALVREKLAVKLARARYDIEAYATAR